MNMRRFEFNSTQFKKFWEIDLRGSRLMIRYGRLNTTGQTLTKKFATRAEAQLAQDRSIAEKMKKGYREVSASRAK
jgi:predicted DNA-binding WGR domain protein